MPIIPSWHISVQYLSALCARYGLSQIFLEVLGGDCERHNLSLGKSPAPGWRWSPFPWKWCPQAGGAGSHPGCLSFSGNIWSSFTQSAHISKVQDSSAALLEHPGSFFLSEVVPFLNLGTTNHPNCGVGEDSWESLGLQGDPTSPFWRRSTLGFLWREWC